MGKTAVPSGGRLTGKVALVTGGARGLGVDQVRGSLTGGARVIFGDILDEEGAGLEQECREACKEGRYVRLNVTSEPEWADVTQTVLKRYGQMDVLVNNEGIVLQKARIEERSAADWDRLMAINLKGTFLGLKYAMPASGGGSIINISSIAAIGQAQLQEPAYAASKAAVRQLTKVVATQHASTGAPSSAPGKLCLNVAYVELHFRVAT